MDMDRPLAILVLGGGPDRERAVSLNSAAEVAAALRAAGHTTMERDILPDDLSALDERCDVVFPVLHGPWGEGGPLQKLLVERDVVFVGSGPEAARLAMDKAATKRIAVERGIATPPSQVVDAAHRRTIEPPAVAKPIDDGSSVGITIARDGESLDRAIESLLAERSQALVERFVAGKEITVGIVADQPLAPIEIAPATAFYDYRAKYDRDDTAYRFEIDLPAETLDEARAGALALHRAIGCRHLSRVDFIVDAEARPWLLEINTMPGFTTHSLLPMAARRGGMDMPALCDRLVRLAMEDAVDRY